MKTRLITALRRNAALQVLTERGLRHLPTAHPALVVASFGRAGSTVVWDALRMAMARARLGPLASTNPEVCSGLAFNFPQGDALRPGIVYKTHDYPDMMVASRRVRAVFLFGSAVEAALSVHEQKALRGEGWVRQHFHHLHRPYRYDALLDADVLGMRDQCVAWMGYTASPVLCLRFEALWDNVDRLSEFCGLEVRLPARKPRKTKEVSPDLLARAKATYAPLDAALAALPDCFEAAPDYARRLREA